MKKPMTKEHRVLKEFKEGKLHSGSKQGPKVKSRRQAIAIAMSEAGKEQEKMNQYTNPWSEERVSQLRELVKQGLSAGQIARELGLSRNAVIGKLSRLGLRLAGRKAEPSKTVRAAVASVRKAPFQIKPRTSDTPAPPSMKTWRDWPASSGKVLSILELEPHHCRFPFDGGRYCGAKRWNVHTSYCEYHALICEPGRGHV